MGTPRAWLIWLIGCAAYAVAVMQRTTFGVVGLDAADRFGTTAGVVSTFVVLQLLVYSTMQIPAGLLLDRYGTRVMLTAGTAAMAAGQLTMALADSLPEGILGRVLVGAGDACIFGAVVRLIPTWFPPRRAPMLIQMTGQLGQLGQVASAVPFAALNASSGWTAAFVMCAAVALTMSLAAGVFVRDTPSGEPLRTPADEVGSLRHQIALAWSHPATRLGLASHFTTCFPSVVFGMMWGFPYLQQGEGLPGPLVGLLMTVYVVAQLIFGPLFGGLVQRYPEHRIRFAFVIVAAIAIPWATVLLWPGRAPLWLLVLLVVGVGTSGPGAALSLDFTRAYTPPARLGTAIGVANMGGFTAGLAAVLAIGVVLDLSSGGSVAYGLGDFRVALATQFVFLALGSVAMLAAYRQLKRHLAESPGE